MTAAFRWCKALLFCSHIPPMLYGLVLAFLLLAAPPVRAQTVTLDPFPVDTSYAVVTTQRVTQITSAEPATAPLAVQLGGEQRMQMQSVGTVGVEVSRVGANRRVRLEQERVQLEVASDQLPAPLSIDTDRPDSLPDELGALSAMLGVSLTLVQEADSLRYDSLDAYIDEVLDRIAGPASEVDRAPQRMGYAFAMGAPAKQLGMTYAALPDRPVAAGVAWDVRVPILLENVDADLVGTMTLTAIDGSEVTFVGPVVVEMSSSPFAEPAKLSGTGTISVTFDTRTGQATSRQNVALVSVMEIPDGAGGSGLLRIKTDLDVTEQRRLR